VDNQVGRLPGWQREQHGLRSFLNDLGTDYIYCVGGSQSGVNTVTGRVFRYNPVTDSLTTVAGG